MAQGRGSFDGLVVKLPIRATVIAKRGRGSGTIRKRRLEAMTADWPVCSHKCLLHGVWSHLALPNRACHLPMFHECAYCLEVPTGYGYVLMRPPRA